MINSETRIKLRSLIQTMKKAKKISTGRRVTKKAELKDKSVDHTTEEKIKEAARKVFTIKGYAAARTRDIAQEAGINLALLNYYFRSKEKLFDIIMTENMQRFMKGVKNVFEDADTSLNAKTRLLVSNYINMLVMHPDLPLFILSELRSNPGKLVERMGVKEFIFRSVYFRQLTAAIRDKGIRINPLHYFMNTLALVVFPFIGSPILKNIADMKPEQFTMLMQERSQLIPKWVEAMMKIK